MTPDPTKPKRHPLPRLWMQIADTLRPAKPFEIRVRMSKDEAARGIRGMRDIREMQNLSYKIGVSDFYVVDTEIPGKPGEFIVEYIQQPFVMMFLKGAVREEENMYITVVVGKVYPGWSRILLFIGISFIWINCVYIALLLHFLIMPLLAYVTAAIILIAYIYWARKWFLYPDRLLKTFTEHLKAAEAERASLE